MSHPESDSGFERPSRAFDEIVAKYLALRHEDDDIDLTEYLASVPAELRPECRETILAALAFEELEPRARPSGGGAGRVVADYRLIREIGRGGMGVVYEAEQISLGRRVALKLLPSGLLATSRQVERFRREAAAVAKLRHPGIVPIYTTGELDGIHFFAMELVEGISLDREIESRRAEQDEDPREARDDTPSPTARISEIVARVAEALQYSHDQGIIHRDVKPHNILLDRSGLPRLVDFGLAKDDEAGSLSVSGDLVGTVHYMSPEQLLAKSHLVDHRTDVYSLGVVLYELLTLQLPFQGRSAQEILVKINTREPKSIRKLNPRVARDLETICSKAMSKDPNGRYATAGELAADLRRFLRLEPIQAKPPGRLERTLKWARREPARALAAALAALLLLGTPTAIAIVLEIARQEAVSERNEKDRALADAKRSAEAATLASLEAQKQAARYIAIDDFVNRFLFSVAPGNHGERITMLEVIDEAARELEANPPDALDVEVELRRKLGTTYSLLGRYPEALDQLDKGLSGVATLPEELDPLRAELHYQRGRVLDRTNRGREAIESFSRALALHQKYAEGDTGEIAAIKSNIVLIEGRLSDDHCMWESQIAALAPFVQLSPEAFRDQSERALTHLRELWDAGRHDEALAFAAQTIAPYTQVPEVIVARGHIGTGIGNIASFRAHIGDFSAAIPIAEFATLFFREHGIAPSDEHLLSALTSYGQILVESGHLERAEAVFTEELRTVESVFTPTNPLRVGVPPLLARVWIESGRLGDAERLLSAQPQWTLLYRFCLGVLRAAQHRFDEAAALTQDFLADEATPENYEVLLFACELLRRSGRTEEAVSRLKHFLDRETPVLQSSCDYNRRGAEYRLARVQPELARCLIALGRLEEAGAAQEAGRHELARICGLRHPHALDALEASIQFALASGQRDLAAQWAKELVERTPQDHPAREGRGMLLRLIKDPEELPELTLQAFVESEGSSMSFQYLVKACELLEDDLARSQDREIVMGCAQFGFGDHDGAAERLSRGGGSNELAEALRLTVLAKCQAERGHTAAARAMADAAAVSIESLPDHQAKVLTDRLSRALPGK